MAADEYEDEEDFKDDAGSSQRSRQRARAERQLSRGKIRSLGDKLTGGPERPGEQSIGRSPFVLGMVGAIAGLGLLAAIFYYIINTTSEQRTLEAAMTALQQQKYGEAEQRLLQFLEAYPKSESSDAARIALHKTRVEKFVITDTPDVVNGLKELKSMLTVCRDLEGFDQERENVRRYADRLTYAGAFVANVIQKQEPLDVSKEAMEILRRFSGESGIPRDREDELERRQRLAEASILKRSVFVTALNTIRSQLEDKDTIGAIRTRAELLDQYDVFREDAEVAAVLDEILDREQELNVRDETTRDALTTESASSTLPALSPTLRTQGRNDLVSQGRLVFGVGIDSVYAMDADTGEPSWRRVIGTDSPFAPVTISGSSAALLTFNTNVGELVLLNQEDGSLIWRQPLTSLPTGPPLIHEQQIYLTTDDGRLLQIAAATGRIQAALQFTQKIIGPPALSRDGSMMVVPGDDTLVYTLTTGTLACKAASLVPHRPGSIQSPMVTMGEIFLICDNDTPDRCRLRTLVLDEETGRLSIRSADYVDGAVRDPCLLRGRELFVPSAPQRITAFRVTDDPDQPPLARIGSNQLEDGEQTKMFLLAGPGGQLWLAGRSLRKFQTRTNAVLLDAARTAEGVHLQPIQFVDESVFLTSRQEWSSSVFFTRADREEMVGLWRTVVGNHFVAIGPSAGGQSLLAVADFGEVYRIPFEELKKGGFWLDSISRFRLPDKLASPVDGIRLNDGRLAAWCGAEEPALWTISQSGQLERRWNLPDAPEATPVAVGNGLVVPLPGRLHLTGVADVRAEDYRAAAGQGGQSRWKHLTALSDTQVLAVTADNRLVRVEYRDSPRPQLAEVSITRSEHSIEVAPAAANGLLFTATAEGQLLLQQVETLEVLSSIDLGGVPTAAPRISGDRVFVEVARRELKSFSFDQQLTQTGTAPLEGYPLAGAPLSMSDGSFVMARSDGFVSQLTADGDPGATSLSVGQALAQGPVEAGGIIFVIAEDGSFYPLPMAGE